MDLEIHLRLSRDKRVPSRTPRRGRVRSQVRIQSLSWLSLYQYTSNDVRARLTVAASKAEDRQDPGATASEPSFESLRIKQWHEILLVGQC